MQGRVVVLGSLNSDHTVWVDRLPVPGETVLADEWLLTLGGKGLNQAVTARRQGAKVTMVGSVGDDGDGDRLLMVLGDEGVDAGMVRRHADLPTGKAYITVDRFGANTIAVVPGANLAVDFPSAALDGADVLLAQLECRLDVVAAALHAARTAGVITVLNPSPAVLLETEVLALVDYLVPNQTEAETLGVLDLAEMPGTVIMTCGSEGAVVRKQGRERRLPAFPAREVVDPTAAGDAFCGTLAAGLALGWPFGVVLRRAAAAGAYAVGVAGALPSLPTAADVDTVLNQAAVKANPKPAPTAAVGPERHVETSSKPLPEPRAMPAPAPASTSASTAGSARSFASTPLSPFRSPPSPFATP